MKSIVEVRELRKSFGRVTALLGCLAIAAVFAPLAVRAYRRSA